jgi:hypothetical protein
MKDEPPITHEGDQVGRPVGPRILGSAGSTSRPRVIAPVTADLTETSFNSAPPINREPPAAASEKANAEGNGQGAIQSDILVEAVQVTRSALETLLSKTHDIQAESWRLIQSLFEDLHLKLCREFEGRLAGFEKEFHDRGRYQTTALLELVDLEAESRLAARVDEALDKAREGERRGVRSLDDKVEASRTSLAEIANKATQELERQKKTYLDDLQIDAQIYLGELKTQHTTDFRITVQKTEDELSQQFTQKTNDALQAFQERLSETGADIIGRMETRLMALTDTAIARVSSEAETIVTRETSSHLIEVLRGRLDQLMNSLKD